MEMIVDPIAAVTYQDTKSVLTQFHATFELLSHAIQSYSSVCAALQVVCSRTPYRSVPNAELEDALVAVDSKIHVLASEVERLESIRVSLSVLRNRSITLASVNKLPPEILCSIFGLSRSYCAFDHARKSSYCNFTGVCSYWRKIALGSAGLWTHVDLNTGAAASGLATLLLGRTVHTPIHVHLHEFATDASQEISENDLTRTITLLAPHMHRVHSLDVESQRGSPRLIRAALSAWLDHGDRNIAKVLSIRRPTRSLPFLYTAERTEEETILPNVNAIRLRGFLFGWNSSIYRGLVDLQLDPGHGISSSVSLPELYGILSASPALAILKLARISITQPVNWVQSPRIILNYLKVLGLHKMLPEDLARLLLLIGLPESAEQLSVSLVAHTDAIAGLGAAFGHSRIARLYLVAPIGDYRVLLNFPTSNSLSSIPKVVFGGLDLRSSVTHFDSAIPQLSSLGPPDIIVHKSTVSFQSLEHLVTNHRIQSLQLVQCMTSPDESQGLEDIRIMLLDLYPDLNCYISDMYPAELEACDAMFAMFE